MTEATERQLHLIHLGAQQQLTDPAVWDDCFSHHFDYVRLGAARARTPELEPLIRDADVAAFHLGALDHYSAPAAPPPPSPSGFTLQEACQLAYYAGNSDKLTSYGLFGWDTTQGDERDQELTAATYAQLAWYFLHGLSRRAGDFPATTQGMTEYVVDVPNFDRLTFWRSPRSNRWWVQYPAGVFRGEQRHRLLPCSPADYQRASGQGELPERLLRGFRRFD